MSKSFLNIFSDVNINTYVKNTDFLHVFKEI